MDADSEALALRADVLVKLLTLEEGSRADIAGGVLLHGFNVATSPNGTRAYACGRRAAVNG
jgi:hypothetical protein